VLRGLVATRQVHTISMGHAPHFYVAGTLPEFETAATAYASSAMPASAYFMRSFDREEEARSALVSRQVVNKAPAKAEEHVSAKPQSPRTPVRKPAVAGKPETARPRFGRSSTLSRGDRKPGKSSTNGHSARRGSDARPSSSRAPKGTRPASPARWTQSSGKSANGNGNGQHNGHHGAAHPVNGSRSTSSTSRPSNGAGTTRPTKPAATAWTKRNGHATGLKSTATSGTPARKGSVRKDSRPEVRAARGTRKPPMTAGASSGNSKRFGFAARAKQGTKKRG